MFVIIQFTCEVFLYNGTVFHPWFTLLGLGQRRRGGGVKAPEITIVASYGRIALK